MKKPVLATSEFCGPCKMLKPRLDQMNAVYETRDMVVDREFFTEYAIRSVPTLITPEGDKIGGSDQILAYFSRST